MASSSAIINIPASAWSIAGGTYGANAVFGNSTLRLDKFKDFVRWFLTVDATVTVTATQYYKLIYNLYIYGSDTAPVGAQLIMPPQFKISNAMVPYGGKAAHVAGANNQQAAYCFLGMSDNFGDIVLSLFWESSQLPLVAVGPSPYMFSGQYPLYEI